MAKADLGLSDRRGDGATQVTEEVLEPIAAPGRTARPDPSVVHARRVGLLLMIASSVLTLVLIGVVWVMIGRLL